MKEVLAKYGKWLLPLTLADPYFISIKAGLASAFAVAFSIYVADNPDLVSACFIAVISISPTPLLGLRSSIGQLFNSAIGAGWGLLMRAVGLDLIYGIGLAVLLSIFSSFVARQSNYYASSAFSAYFVQAIPYGGLGHTMRIRMLALSVGSVCALAVNLLNAIFFTRHMLWRRLRIARNMVVDVVLPQEDPDLGKAEQQKRYFQSAENIAMNVEPVFMALNTLLGELNSVSIEAKFIQRLARTKFHWLEQYSFRVQKLQSFLRLAMQFGYELHKARKDASGADEEKLYTNVRSFLTTLCHELRAVHMAKTQSDSLLQVVSKQNEQQHTDRWEMIPELQGKYLQLCAEDLVGALEDIQHGVPVTTFALRKSAQVQGSLINPDAQTTSTISMLPTREDAANQFYRDVGFAATVAASSSNSNSM